MPSFLVTAGYITVPASSQVAFSLIPNDLGIDGPVISASSIAVLRPLLAALTASIEVTSDLPTPPLPLTTAITFLTLILFAFLTFCGSVLSPQSEPQLPQSCVHSSLIFLPLFFITYNLDYYINIYGIYLIFFFAAFKVKLITIVRNRHAIIIHLINSAVPLGLNIS